MFFFCTGSCYLLNKWIKLEFFVLLERDCLNIFIGPICRLLGIGVLFNDLIITYKSNRIHVKEYKVHDYFNRKGDFNVLSIQS